MFAVYYFDNWLLNIPAQEALIYKEEGYEVLRMDLFYKKYPQGA